MRYRDNQIEDAFLRSTEDAFVSPFMGCSASQKCFNAYRFIFGHKLNRFFLALVNDKFHFVVMVFCFDVKVSRIHSRNANIIVSMSVNNE